MKKQILLATALLLLLPLIAFADEIRLTSTKTQSIDLNIITSAATTVTVDWGDGTPVPVSVTTTDINGSATTLSGIPVGEIIVKGDGITMFDCSLASVTAVNVKAAPNLIKLSVNNNLLSSLDLSANTALYSLHVESNPLLTALDVTKNTALQLLYCNDNNMTALDVTQNTQLTTLNFTNNKLTSIDLSKNIALKSLYALNNLIQSVDVSNNVNATYLSFNGNKLTRIDVTPLTALKSLFLLNNNITELVGATGLAKTATLNCSGNKLNFATLPQPEVVKSTFNYAPQQPLEIQASIKVGESLDLSAQNSVKGVLTAPVATTYAWATKSGTALVKGTDYTETNGVFTFLKTQTETVICSMSTTAFPKFTGTSVLKSTELTVMPAPVPTAVENPESTSIAISANGASGALRIQSESEIRAVAVYTANGLQVWSSAPKAATTELPALSAGVYVIKIVTAKESATIKQIVR